jgi:hypothetical protein
MTVQYFAGRGCLEWHVTSLLTPLFYSASLTSFAQVSAINGSMPPKLQNKAVILVCMTSRSSVLTELSLSKKAAAHV